MTATRFPETPTTGSTRSRLLDTALELFTSHGFAGTSLQMIADRLGITKAAVYHHFKTRDEILTAVVAPAFAEVRAVVADASAQRSPTARAGRMLTGLVDIAIRHRALIGLIGADPAIKGVLRHEDDASILVDRPRDLLAAHQPGPAGRVCAEVALLGIAAAVSKPGLRDLDDQTLRHHLIDAGRRLLGLRRPPDRLTRRPAHGHLTGPAEGGSQR